MKWRVANQMVEQIRRDTRLYLPALSDRRGFSSSRVEHLLNYLVAHMPVRETYLEIGTLEGRTLESAAIGNKDKILVGVDPCEKYAMDPDPFPDNVVFLKDSWQNVLEEWHGTKIGLAFYDGDHSVHQTRDFMDRVTQHMADEAVLVLDDWDRESVREGAFGASDRWQLLRECPEYTDGLTMPQHHFGYSFGISIWGFRR